MLKKLITSVVVGLLLTVGLVAFPAQAQTSTCLATTSAPTWTTNTPHTLSCTTDGKLRTGDSTGFNGFSTPRITTLATVAITRPGDTNALAANDAYANSTSAPTTGGFTLTSACASSGGFGEIRSAQVFASAGTAYLGEIWVFDQAVTAINDNAAFDVSDSDVVNRVAVIPFNTTDTDTSNSTSFVSNIGQAYTCVGTANLRFLVKIMSAVTPGNAEVLSVRVQVQN